MLFTKNTFSGQYDGEDYGRKSKNDVPRVPTIRAVVQCLLNAVAGIRSSRISFEHYNRSPKNCFLNDKIKLDKIRAVVVELIRALVSFCAKNNKTNGECILHLSIALDFPAGGTLLLGFIFSIISGLPRWRLLSPIFIPRYRFSELRSESFFDCNDQSVYAVYEPNFLSSYISSRPSKRLAYDSGPSANRNMFGSRVLPTKR